MEGYSKLEQARLNRRWSRAHVEKITNGRIPEPTLTNWEKKRSFPRDDSIKELCRLYNATPEQLGLVKADTRGIMGTTANFYAPQEGTPMSDIVRRAVFSNLGSKLTSLIDLWPKRNYHYEELQGGINRAILEYNTLVAQEPGYEFNRRDALKSMALVPVQLVGGLTVIGAGKVQKTDTDILLKHCAAGITACWYLRRGKELTFVSGLISEYIKILQPLIYSHSEVYRKASATLLSQSFGLKSKLTNALQEDDQALAYEEEAIRYASVAESVTDQAIANREMALFHWRRKKYRQALPYAKTAYGLAKSNKATPKIILSFTASGLSFCQAFCGHTEDAQISLKEAHDLFDPTMLIPSIPYNEAVLSAVDAYAHQYIGNFKEAIDIYQQYKTFPDVSALGAIENNIDYAKAEVSRDDKPRDMELCITLLTEAITGARELDSKWYIREARETFDLFRIVWPRENAIKILGRDHFGIK